MGINICIEKLDGTEHPDWDCARYVGDRDFMEWMRGLPYTRAGKVPTGEHDDLDDNWHYFRPDDIDAWEARLPQDRCNPDRFLTMFKILRENPDYWIYLSL